MPSSSPPCCPTTATVAGIFLLLSVANIQPCPAQSSPTTSGSGGARLPDGARCQAGWQCVSGSCTSDGESSDFRCAPTHGCNGEWVPVSCGPAGGTVVCGPYSGRMLERFIMTPDPYPEDPQHEEQCRARNGTMRGGSTPCTLIPCGTPPPSPTPGTGGASPPPPPPPPSRVVANNTNNSNSSNQDDNETMVVPGGDGSIVRPGTIQDDMSGGHMSPGLIVLVVLLSVFGLTCCCALATGWYRYRRRRSGDKSIRLYASVRPEFGVPMSRIRRQRSKSTVARGGGSDDGRTNDFFYDPESGRGTIGMRDTQSDAGGTSVSRNAPPDYPPTEEGGVYYSYEYSTSDPFEEYGTVPAATLQRMTSILSGKGLATAWNAGSDHVFAATMNAVGAMTRATRAMGSRSMSRSTRRGRGGGDDNMTRYSSISTMASIPLQSVGAGGGAVARPPQVPNEWLRENPAATAAAAAGSVLGEHQGTLSERGDGALVELQAAPPMFVSNEGGDSEATAAAADTAAKNVQAWIGAHGSKTPATPRDAAGRQHRTMRHQESTKTVFAGAEIGGVRVHEDCDDASVITATTMAPSEVAPPPEDLDGSDNAAKQRKMQRKFIRGVQKLERAMMDAMDPAGNNVPSGFYVDAEERTLQQQSAIIAHKRAQDKGRSASGVGGGGGGGGGGGEDISASEYGLLGGDIP